jgi:hypothetical protein
VTGNGGSNPLTILSGQGTPCVIVSVPPGYNGGQKLKVFATNCKGQGGSREIAVGLLAVPNMPGAISGLSSVCKSQFKSYSVSTVSGATAYTWSVTGNALIAAGQGTNNVTIDFNPSDSASVVLSVIAGNGCGSSSPRTKTIAVNPACKIIADPVGPHATTLLAYPNPAHGKITVSLESDFTGNYVLRLMDVLGNVHYHDVFNFGRGLYTKELDVSGFPKGIYLLQLQDPESRIKTMRMVVE